MIMRIIMSDKSYNKTTICILYLLFNLCFYFKGILSFLKERSKDYE